MIITSKKILKILTRGTAHAMAVYPFILLENKSLKSDTKLLNHERIHLHQQRELLILVFYFLYFTEYFIRRVQYRSHHEAYLNISFEREAYRNQDNLDYLTSRPRWSFLNYYKC